MTPFRIFMTHGLHRPAFVVLLAWGLAWAGPGAHGPNGEHLDAPAGAAQAAAVPRLEAHSDLFEIVASLQGGELSLLIDRYASNEPVFDAVVEVASGPHRVRARFHDDHGDYAVEDAALIKLLAMPGEHALVISVQAGADSDLLDGVLRVSPANGASEGRAVQAWGGWPWLVGVLLVLAAIAYGWRHRAALRRQLNGGRA